MAGRVPRLFWSDGFIAYNLKRVLIIADYDLIVKMFKDPNVSARLTTPKGYLAQKYERISRGLEVELEALGMKEGTNYGLASGVYDQVRSLIKCKNQKPISGTQKPQKSVASSSNENDD